MASASHADCDTNFEVVVCSGPENAGHCCCLRDVICEREKLKETEEEWRTRKQHFQIQDEENVNLKEQIRVDVRKELRKVEMNCTDMASLLRGLGIQVRSGLHPSSQEVQAANKKALLKFHPDRVSTTDVRQQVEAEEKFKLISHMKKKKLC